MQYLIIFAKSLSIDLRPRSSCHFLEAFVNAFFLLLYLHKSNYNGCILANKLQVTASVTCQPHHNERRLHTLWINLTKIFFISRLNPNKCSHQNERRADFRLILICSITLCNRCLIYVNIKALPVFIKSSTTIFRQMFRPYCSQGT